MEIPTRETKHACKTCKGIFKEYLYWEDCQCNDGEDEDGNRCLGCGGKGEYTAWIKNECRHCLTDRIEEYD